MAAFKQRAPYPFVVTESAKLYSEPQPTWDRLFADIASAAELLLVENYIFEDGLAGGAVAEALIAAAERGVEVRVQVDSVGSLRLGSALQTRMRKAGVELRFFNPIRLHRVFRVGRLYRMLFRTHRRILVVDKQVGWVGGLAFGDDWWPSEGGCPARESMLRFTGPMVVQLIESFYRLWQWPPRPRWSKSLRPAEPGEARLVTQYAGRGAWYRKALHYRLARSRVRAWLAAPYFIPPLRLRARLRTASRRQVDVRLLLPGSRHDHPAVWHAGRRYYATLLACGVRIFEYQPRFFHAKVALFDDEWSLAGSPNLDRWSLLFNHELAVEMRGSEVHEQMLEQFESDFAQSEEIQAEAWLRRPWQQRFLERFFGLFDRLF